MGDDQVRQQLRSWYHSLADAVDFAPEQEREEEDEVNSPSHYARTSGLECIDAMAEAFGEEQVRIYSKLAAFKYLWRQDWKHPTPDKDVRKAIWYLRRSLGEDPRCSG